MHEAIRAANCLDVISFCLSLKYCAQEVPVVVDTAELARHGCKLRNPHVFYLPVHHTRSSS